MLKSLDHPGVVRFIGTVDTPDGGRAMHTEFVSSDTWATRPLTDPAERAAGVAALAAVVADLHDLGIAHCQLSTAHVLHGEDDRPVLCGLRLGRGGQPQQPPCRPGRPRRLVPRPQFRGRASHSEAVVTGGRHPGREAQRPRAGQKARPAGAQAVNRRRADPDRRGRGRQRQRRTAQESVQAQVAHGGWSSAGRIRRGPGRGHLEPRRPGGQHTSHDHRWDRAHRRVQQPSGQHRRARSSRGIGPAGRGHSCRPGHSRRRGSRRRRRHNRSRGTRSAGLGDSRRRGFGSRRERSRGRGARRIPRADGPRESSTAAPEPDRIGSGEAPALTPFRSQAARRQP